MQGTLSTCVLRHSPLLPAMPQAHGEVFGQLRPASTMVEVARMYNKVLHSVALLYGGTVLCRTAAGGTGAPVGPEGPSTAVLHR